MKQIFEDDLVYFLRIKQFIQNLLCIQTAAIDCECQWSTAGIIDHKL
jgi:hypothetical protein